MVDKLTNTKAVSPLDIALGDKGYVSQDAPMTVSNMTLNGVDYGSGTLTMRRSNTHEEHRVMTVVNALRMAQCIAYVVERYGRQRLEGAVYTASRGTTRELQHLPESCMEDFEYELRRSR